RPWASPAGNPARGRRRRRAARPARRPTGGRSTIPGRGPRSDPALPHPGLLAAYPKSYFSAPVTAPSLPTNYLRPVGESQHELTINREGWSFGEKDLCRLRGPDASWRDGARYGLRRPGA